MIAFAALIVMAGLFLAFPGPSTCLRSGSKTVHARDKPAHDAVIWGERNASGIARVL